jgi:hypothetical protein
MGFACLAWHAPAGRSLFFFRKAFRWEFFPFSFNEKFIFYSESCSARFRLGCLVFHCFCKL